jgi:uncharacterized protein YndB with AHSA1/START domain
MSAKPGRWFEKRFKVAAPAEAVWKAITDGEELTRWFCVHATCESGVGGHQHIDWGGGVTAEQIVTVWDPDVHLRTEAARPDKTGDAAPDPPEPYATDWYLEHESGVTSVRMVASGFGEGPDWDHEYEGTFHGWDMFHKLMKHYLEHHRGQPSGNVVLYADLSVPPEEAWARLMGQGGLAKKGSLKDLSIGAPFQIETSQDDSLAGTVCDFVPGKRFSALVESLNQAILNLEIACIPGRGHFLYVSLMTWGLPAAEVDALRTRIKTVVFGLFPQTTETPYAARTEEASKP